MTNAPQFDDDQATPFLTRFLRPLEQPAGAVAYDPVAAVNVVSDKAIPAVEAGFDVKTLGAVAED
jgi:hypothetical protein